MKSFRGRGGRGLGGTRLTRRAPRIRRASWPSAPRTTPVFLLHRCAMRLVMPDSAHVSRWGCPPPCLQRAGQIDRRSQELRRPAGRRSAAGDRPWDRARRDPGDRRSQAGRARVRDLFAGVTGAGVSPARRAPSRRGRRRWPGRERRPVPVRSRCHRCRASAAIAWRPMRSARLPA
jgi:hypothetical protein